MKKQTNPQAVCVLEDNSSRDTKFIKITSVHLPWEIFVSQVVSGCETRRSITCVCFAHLLFLSGLLTLLEVGYWAGQALRLTHYSCSHVCKLWDFKHFKNPERNGLLPKYHVGFVFIFKKVIKFKMFTRSSRNFARKQLLERIRFKGLLLVWLFSVPMFAVLYIIVLTLCRFFHCEIYVAADWTEDWTSSEVLIVRMFTKSLSPFW